MKHHISIKLLLFLTYLLMWCACTDEQFIRNQTYEQDIFFNTANTDSTLKVIVHALKQRNDSCGFVSILTRKYGQPLWNKAFHFQERDGRTSFAVPFIQQQKADEVSAIWLFLQDGNWIQSSILSKKDVIGELKSLDWLFDDLEYYVLKKLPSNGLIFDFGDSPRYNRVGNHIIHYDCRHVTTPKEGKYQLYDDRGYYCWEIPIFLLYIPKPKDGSQRFYEELYISSSVPS